MSRQPERWAWYNRIYELYKGYPPLSECAERAIYAITKSTEQLDTTRELTSLRSYAQRLGLKGRMETKQQILDLIRKHFNDDRYYDPRTLLIYLHRFVPQHMHPPRTKEQIRTDEKSETYEGLSAVEALRQEEARSMTMEQLLKSASKRLFVRKMADDSTSSDDIPETGAKPMREVKVQEVGRKLEFSSDDDEKKNIQHEYMDKVIELLKKAYPDKEYIALIKMFGGEQTEKTNEGVVTKKIKDYLTKNFTDEQLKEIATHETSGEINASNIKSYKKEDEFNASSMFSVARDRGGDGGALAPPETKEDTHPAAFVVADDDDDELKKWTYDYYKSHYDEAKKKLLDDDTTEALKAKLHEHQKQSIAEHNAKEEEKRAEIRDDAMAFIKAQLKDVPEAEQKEKAEKLAEFVNKNPSLSYKPTNYKKLVQRYERYNGGMTNQLQLDSFIQEQDRGTSKPDLKPEQVKIHASKLGADDVHKKGEMVGKEKIKGNLHKKLDLRTEPMSEKLKYLRAKNKARMLVPMKNIMGGM